MTSLYVIFKALLYVVITLDYPLDDFVHSCCLLQNSQSLKYLLQY